MSNLEESNRSEEENLGNQNEESNSTSNEVAEDSSLKEEVSSEKAQDAPKSEDTTIQKEVVKKEVIESPDAEEAKVADAEVESNKNDEDTEDSDDEQHEEEVDYSHYSKSELVEEIKKISHDENILLTDKKAQAMLPVFEEIYTTEKNAALEKFISEGGVEADFDYKNDELTDRFRANFQLIHDRKVQYIRERESSKEDNYKKKLEVLEKLRLFVDSEETNISFEHFKNLQNEWKAIGQIPSTHVKTLWANYNALVDRFYDNRSIYYELKELDRRKNLESKLELCERAEKLNNVENLKDAIQELNELHDEFKHFGPVPQDKQEEVWNRFKAASDAIYHKRKEYVEQLKGSLTENLAKKAELVDAINEFASFTTDRIKLWNSKTGEIIDLQKKWEAVGGLPRAKAKEVNKAFWSAFKQFFHNKGEFFKQLDAQREDNLQKKLRHLLNFKSNGKKRDPCPKNSAIKRSKLLKLHVMNSLTEKELTTEMQIRNL